ncbi:hypothetical protein [Rariglobus hedericola]|uniref:Uncharacterized protein n=1 Tax=Rariglobus hedericola TaxID=2597822 RepID=A0A556QER2_9BACT|nr:hypothetical protein [Rariglobus hedericola]TSJ75139.1 hypothetical protein FPL22_17225 [Rariglobus hedericola]
MPAIPQFGVSWFEGASHVIGRNHDCDLLVGTEFTELVETRMSPQKNTDGSFNIKSEIVRRIAIKCRIQEIMIYRRSVDCLSGGWTARLTLEGPSVREIAQIIPAEASNRGFTLRSIVG